MGYYVHLSVVFAVTGTGKVRELAAKHLPLLQEMEKAESRPDTFAREAVWFLEAVLEKDLVNCGPKGELLTWGIVGNYTQGENFVETLRPFWTDLLTWSDGMRGSERVLVFVEPEQSEQAQAWEIGFRGNSHNVVAIHHKLPFAWMQM